MAIKTVMLNSMMAQCGLHVTCENADICMNSSYLCDIGDGQNLEENLSTFSAHIKNVLEVLQKADKDSFIIMDELGSGTDPAEGMGIAIAILEELKKTGCLFLVTTHYPEVKEYAEKSEGIVNARMTFDQKTLQPTYQMIIGEAGESCAFYIADRLGMPKEMLQTAVRYAYGESNKKDIKLQDKFRQGDSVMVFPDKKIWINHKRVRLQVAASELYPDDYDFSIIFDTVENRKKRHDMERKYTEGEIVYSE